jgi:hypothetical protein
MDDWNMIIAIATAFSALVILGTAIIAIKQLKAIKKSRQLDAFTNFIQFLQREDIREARRVLIEDLSKKKPFASWSKDDIKQAEKACHTYDAVGVMDAKWPIEKNFVVKVNHDSITKCWEAAQPMIEEYRRKRGEDFWGNFENLYKMAKEYEKDQNK